jgi:GMP synthase-like glutamine amidotransferase
MLALTYEREAGPGVFGDPISERGVALDEWLVPEQPDPPADPSSYDALMVLGGYMHPDQEERYPWMSSQKALVRDMFESGIPVLGACLGAQLLTEAAGGSVRRMETPEIGWFDVRVTPEGAGDPVIGAFGDGLTALEWHSYECVPPDAATVLARSDACVQAFRIGERAWGIQFHAEVTQADVNTWIDGWHDSEETAGSDLDPEALRSQTNERISAWNEIGRDLCGRFLDAAATPAVRG